MPSLKQISQENVSSIITPKITELGDMMYVVNQIIEDSKYEINEGLKDLLDRNKIDQRTYEEQLNQTKVELSLRQNSHNEVTQQIDRFKKIQEENQGETQGFVVEESTSRDELKKLIALTKLQISLTQDKDEKLFLSTILQTAESCKTQLDDGRAFDTQIIPMLKSEEKYASSLLSQLNTFEFNKPKSDLIDKYLKKLEAIETIKHSADNDNNLSRPEKVIIHRFCEGVSQEIKGVLNNLSSNSPIDENNFSQKIDDHINLAEARSQKIPVSSGLKGFINKICEVLNKEPVFTVSNSSIVDKIQGYKSQIAPTKQAEPQPKDESPTIDMKIS
jgi:CRISPR/Cas system endoribonuclease Cas6 (RAMP superfamily)